MNTQSELDFSKQERDLAMVAVAETAGEDWIAYAVGVIAKVAKELKRFTSDDVMEALEYRPPDCRALGPAIKRAQTMGIIVATEDFRLSVRRHASPIRVWEANL